MFRSIRIARLFDDPVMAHRLAVLGIVFGAIFALLVIVYIVWTIRDRRALRRKK